MIEAYICSINSGPASNFPIEFYITNNYLSNTYLVPTYYNETKIGREMKKTIAASLI